MTSSARSRAKSRGLPFDLDPEDIQRRVDVGMCEVTGIPFDLAPGRRWNAPSLDQIIPGAGYTKNNVRVVLFALNIMANTWGHQPIVEIAAAMSRRDK